MTMVLLLSAMYNLVRWLNTQRNGGEKGRDGWGNGRSLTVFNKKLYTGKPKSINRFLN